MRELKPWPPAVWFVNVFPAIAPSMAIMAMRNTAYGMQTSGLCSLSQAGGTGWHDHRHPVRCRRDRERGPALFAGRAMRLGDAQRTMLSGSALTMLEPSLRPPRSPRHGLKVPRVRPEAFPNAAEIGREIEFLTVNAGFGPS